MILLIKVVVYSTESKTKGGLAAPTSDTGNAFVGIVATVFRAKGVSANKAKKLAKQGKQADIKKSAPGLFPGPLPRGITHTVLQLRLKMHYNVTSDAVAASS